MNKKDKKALQALIDKLVPLVGEIEEALVEVEPQANKAREKFDNMSDRAQEGDKGQALDEEATELDTLKTELEAARDALDNAINAGIGIIEAEAA